MGENIASHSSDSGENILNCMPSKENLVCRQY